MMQPRELRQSAYPLPLHPQSDDDRMFFALRAGKAPRRSILSRIFGGSRG